MTFLFLVMGSALFVIVGVRALDGCGWKFVWLTFPVAIIYGAGMAAIVNVVRYFA